jgi:hypothetical protein
MIIGYRRTLGKEPLTNDAGYRMHHAGTCILYPASRKKGAEKTPPLIRYE